MSIMEFVGAPIRTFSRGRVLTARDQAEIDVEAEITDTFAEMADCKNEAEALDAEATRLTDSATALRGRLVRPGDANPLQLVAGGLAAVLLTANALLAFLMFQAMNLPWILSLPLALVETAVFSGAGALALHELHKGQGARAKVIGLAGLLALIAVAYFAVPQLAATRVEESYGADLAAATATVTVAEARAGEKVSRSEELKVAKARYDLQALNDKRDRGEKVFIILMVMTLFGEVALSSYGFDLASRLCAHRLTRRATRATEDAQAAREDAQTEETTLPARLAEIAQDHAMSLDTIGDIARDRLANPMLAGQPTTTTATPVTPVPSRIPVPTPEPTALTNPPAPRPTPAPTPAPAAVPTPQVGLPGTPGTLTVDPDPVGPPHAIDDWDGMWA